jgi:multiple sugar transport system substrate-binding protein
MMNRAEHAGAGGAAGPGAGRPPGAASIRLTRRQWVGQFSAAVPRASWSAVAGALTACGRQAASSSAPSTVGPPVDLKLWGPPPTVEPGTTLSQQLSELAQKRSNLHVTLEPVATTGTDVTKAIAVLASGTGPDVFYLGRWLTAQFAAYKTISATDKYAARSTTVPLTDFYPRFIAESKWRGDLYGIPYVSSTRGLFLNQAHFQEAGLSIDKPPATWDELDQAAARLLARGADGQLTRVGYVPGAGNPGNSLTWLIYLWQLGGDLLTTDNKQPSPDLQRLGSQALGMMATQMQRAGGWAMVDALSKSTPMSPGTNEFSAGRHSMFMAEQVAMGSFDKVSGLQYSVAALPLPSNGKRVNYASGPNLALFAGSKAPDSAWQVVEYLEDPVELIRFNVAGSTMPPRKSAATSTQYTSKNPRFPFFAAELQYSRWVPIVAGIQDILLALDETITPGIRGEIAPGDAVRNAVIKVDIILKQNAAYL